MAMWEDDDAFGELDYGDDVDEALETEQYNSNHQTEGPSHVVEQADGAEPNEILPDMSDDEMDDPIDPIPPDCADNDRIEMSKSDKMRRDGIHFDELTNLYIGDARKRPKPSVFNDYSPLDWHLRIGEEEQAAKRRRMELEDAVGRATLRILTARVAARQQQKLRSSSDENTTMAKENPYNKIRKHCTRTKPTLLRLPPMNGQAWWGISSVDGDFRRYLSVRRQEKVRSLFDNELGEGQNKGTFAGDAFFAELERAEERMRERQIENEVQIVGGADQNVGGVQAQEHGTGRDPEEKQRTKGAVSQLWTDKYAPHTFLDLLTKDETNRIVLLWLRLWDDYVFGGKRKGLLGHRHSSLWDSLEERDRALFEMDHAKAGARLPKQKILALHGPSGVGKSALARVSALQAGYNPIVIQLGELQNVAELKTRLENATNSTAIETLFHQTENAINNKPLLGTRPCCFIVEAVELAPPEMIQFLCAWTRRARASGAGIVRRRPVLCTCASLWNAPALKELRTAALAVRVQHCDRERMQRRLEQVCREEGVPIGRGQLDELLDTHGSDIRLCLNTLQLKCADKRALNFSRPIEGAGSSSVNTAVSVSLFDTLNAIFTLDFHEDNRGIVRPPPVRARTLLALFGQMAHDDFGRLQQLVFNNFASVLKLNNVQCRFVSALFTQLDLLQSVLQRGQHFVLARYPAFALLRVHFHCALRVARRLPFNLAALPFTEQQREHQQIVRSMRSSAASGAHFVGITDLYAWLAPLLWLVLQPPVQPSLWSDSGGGQQQRVALQRVVELMRSFKIQLVRNNSSGGAMDGFVRYAFEPAFDALIRFPSSTVHGNRSMLISEPIKQYIAQQLEHAPPMQSRHKTDDGEEEDNDSVDQIDNEQNATTTTNITSKGSLLPFQVHPLSSSATTASSSVGGPLFTYRHSAGSSQAVRRDIRIGSLFSTLQH